MLKDTLRILNEILLQGSLSSHWRVSTRLQPFHFFLWPDAICILVFTFGTLWEHYISHVHYNPIGAI